MDTKIIVAIGVVAILAGASIGFAVIKMNEKNSSESEPEIYEVEDVRLLVYGNADNNDAIDSNDVAVIENILKDIEAGGSWDSEATPYADTNYDGSITQDDVDLLNKIINKESCTLYYKEYYMSTTSNVVSINYPMDTTSIGVYQYQPGILMKILGLWDNVTYADDTTRKTTTMFTISDDLKSYGAYSTSMLKTTDGLEMFNSSDVDVLVLNGYYDDTVVKDGLAAMGSSVQVIKPYSQGGYCIATALTTGFILGAYDAAKAYIDYYDEVKAFIDDSVAELPEEDYKTYIVPQSGTDSGNIKISTIGLNGTYPDLDWIMKTIPGTNTMTWGDSDKYIAVRSAEWFLENPTDFIIISIMAGQMVTAGVDVAVAVNQCAEMFQGTNAYTNGNIVGFSYGMLAGLYGPACLPLVAAYMYPDYVDVDKAWELFDEFFEDYPIYNRESHPYSGVYQMTTETTETTETTS